jgi:hypothetical protein
MCLVYGTCYSLIFIIPVNPFHVMDAYISFLGEMNTGQKAPVCNCVTFSLYKEGGTGIFVLFSKCTVSVCVGKHC